MSNERKHSTSNGTPAPVIEPVVCEGVRYTVPNDKGTVGYVVATDLASGKELWRKTVFRVCLCPLIEHDVQWVFIRQMRREGGRLILVNERGKTYSLDLKTRRVRKLKGQSRAGGLARRPRRVACHGRRGKDPR